MKILLLSRYSRLGASSRMRSYQYIPYLYSQGIEVTMAPLFGDSYLHALYGQNRTRRLIHLTSDYLGRLGWMCRRKRFDLIWLEKEILPWIPDRLERLLFADQVPIVVDYDDAIYHRYGQHGTPFVRRLLGKKIEAVMRQAQLVIAGNDTIALRAREAGARRVVCLPTVVDLERYRHLGPDGHDAKKTIRIGWIGSPTTAVFLQQIWPALSAVASDPRVEFIFIGAGHFRLPGIKAQYLPWSEANEVADLNRLDVGIMPLPDTPWCRGKCGYKLIQYMASRKPVVASAVGANLEIVRHGENGFIASNMQEWIQSLQSLIDDAKLCREMGRRGRRLVEERYCLQVTAPRLAAHFKKTAESPAV